MGKVGERTDLKGKIKSFALPLTNIRNPFGIQVEKSGWIRIWNSGVRFTEDIILGARTLQHSGQSVFWGHKITPMPLSLFSPFHLQEAGLYPVGNGSRKETTRESQWQVGLQGTAQGASLLKRTNAQQLR